MPTTSASDALSLRIRLEPMPEVWCRDPSTLHVGLQSGRTALVAGAPGKAGLTFDVEIRVKKGRDGAPDFAGPLVHGKVGDRFLYVVWGEPDGKGGHHRFRRLKIYVSPVERKGWSSPGISWAQIESGRRLVAEVTGRGPDGTPSCGTAPVAWKP